MDSFIQEQLFFKIGSFKVSDNSILAVAQQGIQTGIAAMTKNAAKISSKEAMEDPSILINEVVDMKLNQYQVLASGKVIETVDEMLGTMLDEKT